MKIVPPAARLGEPLLSRCSRTAGLGGSGTAGPPAIQLRPIMRDTTPPIQSGAGAQLTFHADFFILRFKDNRDGH